MNSSYHIPILITSIILWVIGGVGVSNGENRIGFVIIISIAYVAYLISVFCCSDIKSYITNLKCLKDSKSFNDGIKDSKGYFIFNVECYHEETRTDDAGSLHSEKVVTHQASEYFTPKLCKDSSGKVSGIADIKKYKFISYCKKFYFADK